MLTELRFKNWRSLRDVTIELTPITVFIGANSSGKTNILDALYFLRYAMESRPAQATFVWGGREKILTQNIPENKNQVEIQSKSNINREHLIQGIFLEFSKDNDGVTSRSWINDSPSHGGYQYSSSHDDEDMPSYAKIFQKVVTKRWQLLGENFAPPLNISTKAPSSIEQIEPLAENLLWILHYMKQESPIVYGQLQEDFAWLLGHVQDFDSIRTEHELKLIIHEKIGGREAPSISSGTARLLAMLTAFYALDMENPELPGLVVIEEPDTALNPGLLRRFVNQLRFYAKNENPRQIILTTHNPSFLNLFEPEEVRIVEMDEQGFTSVSRVPEFIREQWLDEYGLGEVWFTNLMGGVAT
jgi:predicted ATPase